MTNHSLAAVLLWMCSLSFSLVLQAQKTREAKIDSMMQSLCREDGPGIAISVVKDNSIIYHTETGYVNLEYKVPITDHTVFHVASISKQFTVFATMLLQEEGKLNLDDDIRTYLPELKDFPKITIRQLANHTSGYRNAQELMNIIGFADHDFMSHRRMVEILLQQKGLNFEPGERFQYNNAGFILLAEIIERVSGQSFTAFTQERIFTPLGMANSFFLDDPFKLVPNKAYSYRWVGEEYEKLPLNVSTIGATGLNTTPHDLSLWAMNFKKHTIGSADIFQQMRTQSTLNFGAKISYTLGQEVKQYKGLNAVFHGGGDAGYRAYLLRFPEQDFALVIMGNFEEFNPLDIAFPIADLYLAEHLKEEPETIPAYTTKELRAFEGDYQVFPGLYVTLFAKDDTLFFTGYGGEGGLALPVVGDRSFLFPHRPHSYLEFNRKDGFLWHFSDFCYPAHRVELAPPSLTADELDEYSGEYYSEELETIYSFSVVEGELVAAHALNWDTPFRPLAKDTFISDSWFFSRIEAVRNAKGEITALNISGQNANDIRFEKRTPRDPGP